MMLGKEMIRSKTMWFYLLLLVFSIFTNMGLGNVLSENIPVSDYAIFILLSRRFLFISPLGLANINHCIIPQRDILLFCWFFSMVFHL